MRVTGSAGLGTVTLLLGCFGKIVGDDGSDVASKSSAASGNGAAAVACSLSAGSGSASLDPSPICKVTFNGCADGNTYSVDCPGAPASCTCALNGSPVKSFDTRDVCGGPKKAIPAINEACGWNLSGGGP